MARKNFTQFELRSPVLTSDFVVGYRFDGITEYRARVQDIVNTVQSGIAQQLSFNEETKDLSISLGGNTVSLSSLTETEFATVSSSFAHLLTSPLLRTSIYQDASGNWQDAFTTVQTNSAGWSNANIVSTQIQNLTGNWESTYTTVRQNSAFWATGTGSTLMSGVISGDLVVTGQLTASDITLSQAIIEVGDNYTDSPSALAIQLNSSVYNIPLYTIPRVAINGYDNAADVVYSDTLEIDDGDNGGTGFQPWEVDVDSAGGVAATYVGSAVSELFGDIDTEGLSFGLKAAGVGSGAYARVTRPLTTSLVKGNALSATIAAAFRSGDKGVILYDGNNNEIYRFAITDNNYVINGTNIDWPYTGTTSIFNIEARQTEQNEVTVNLTKDSESTTNIVSGQVSKITFYISETNSGTPRENIRFNSLKLYPYITGGVEWTPRESGLNIPTLTNYLSTNHVTISSATILQDLIIYGTLSAISAQNIALTSYEVTQVTTTSSLEVSGALNVFGTILSSNINLSNIFVTNSYFRQISGDFVTTSSLNQTLEPYVRSISTLETPTTGISAIGNIVALSQATYDALVVKQPTTLYIIV